MPKTTSKRETGSVVEVRSFTVGTLAARTALVSSGPAVTRGGRLLSSTIAGGLDSGTLGDPKLAFGIMNGDFTQAELEAFLELNGPLSPALIAESEIASRGRHIRTLGVIDPSPGSAAGVIFLENKSLSGLVFSEAGEGADPGWDWWIYNLSPTTAMTTGGLFGFSARNFVEWNPSG